MKMVTGANGFLGRALVAVLADKNISVLSTVRKSSVGNEVSVGDIGPNTDWLPALDSVDTVIHTAARVHVMDDAAGGSLAAFRQVNVDGTRQLAEQAAWVGVRRFVFISSIKVNGENSSPGKPFMADESLVPRDPYSISKYEAEEVLKQVAADTGMEVTIIRPPLVYGPGVKANFFNMMRWLYKVRPLPLGAIHNKRSLVALDNLLDLIVTCINHPAAANQTFLVSDGEDLSTTELLKRMAVALGKPELLLPVPPWLLKIGAELIGKSDIAQRLLGSLQVDISKTRDVLDWTPPVSVDEALKKTAEDFLARQ